MKLMFLGAARTVTGSCYLLRDGGWNVLVDCGLFQGRKELRLRNWAPFPVNPARIDAVILTHAHLDHSGSIPRLMRAGFRGPVFCSEATRDLCAILLPDSGKLQEEDAERANRKGYTKHAPALPLYTEEEARESLGLFRPVSFGRPHALGDFARFTLHHAGHILGASFVRVDDGGRSVLFSGDLGRPDDPVMRAPAHIQDADYIVVESTYGDRLHENIDPKDRIADIVNRTVKRGGTIVVPAFAVGRAQEIMYCLYMLKREKRIPQTLPVWLDSPMAINAAGLMRKHPKDHRLPEGLCAEVCGVAGYVRTPAESKKLDESMAPAVIISASGMATGGRVLHHLKRFMGDRRNTIMLAGYQAQGTRGDRMARGEAEIKIHGQMRPLKAEVVMLHHISAHADSAELLGWLSGLSRPPVKVFVTHGEERSAETLAGKIRERFGWQAEVPDMLSEATL